MARIRIEDLPENRKISEEDMKKVFGGPTRRPDNIILLNEAAQTDYFAPGQFLDLPDSEKLTNPF